MNYQRVQMQGTTLYGLKVELSTSHTTNQKIITKHWQVFNAKLKANNINLGVNWKKYGITLKIEGRYYYMIAVPSSNEISQFEQINLESSYCLYFKHLGSMDLIKFTINMIYKKVISQSGFSLNATRQVIHFECYDKEFRWNYVDSVIHIYVPVEG